MKANFDINNFTREHRALLYMSGQAEWNENISDTFKSADKKKLVTLAEKHRITPLLFRYLNNQKSNIDAELIDELRAISREHILKTLNLQSELIKICSEFNRSGLAYMVIKGPQLSHLLYGDASVRVCVDLDIFLQKPKDIFSAADILIHLGFRGTNLPEKRDRIKRLLYRIGKHECSFYNRQSRTFIDLHLRPVGNSVFSARYHRKFFSGVQPYDFNGTAVSAPSAKDYFLYLCHHGAVHQFGSLHWLADISAFIQKYPIPVEELFELASTLRLRKHMILSFLLMNRLCGIPVPEHYLKEWGKSKVIKVLYGICVKCIQREESILYSLKERLEKTWYRFLLAEGFSGKADTILSIFTRYFYRMINRKGYKLSQRD